MAEISEEMNDSSQRPGGKTWKSSKCNQKIVMNEHFVKNIVMDDQIDPMAVMDLSIFKCGGRNNLQPRNQKMLE